MAIRQDPKQTSLFKTEIPEMPDGYYSSGPNPNLRRFVEEHATPYNPETDDYDIPPFDKPIKTTKATAIYNMHIYWSKKPHDAIQEYIKHYTKPGDVVLDPMCGSGGTALAALMEGRTAIAIDLSPAATFITKNYCTPVDINELELAYEKLMLKIQPEIDWLYETRCDRCDGKATTAYTVYSHVFQCPRCLERVALFEGRETTGLTKSGKKKKIIVCPLCYGNGHIEEISTRNKRYDPIPVKISYLCLEGCKPRRAERSRTDKDPRKKHYFHKFDLGKIREIKSKQIPYWYPNIEMIYGKETKRNRNITGGDWYSVSDLFTKRNLWAQSILLNGVKNTENDALLFTFESNILSGSIMQQYREAGGGFAKGTYYVPQIFIEREQSGCFNRKYNDVKKSITYINNSISSTLCNISTESATSLESILDNSIDHIFTDPPYADKVQFGELNYVWEAWMDFNLEWHGDEIIINEVRGKSDYDWKNMMFMAMTECFRVIKPGRWISLCYHDTSEGTWQLIQDIMAEVGFISEVSETSLYIDAAQKSYVQLTADKVTKRDLVINFRKPRPDELTHQLTLFDDEYPTTFAQKAHTIIMEFLEIHPGSSSDRLYDDLVSRMVRKGEFERHNFEELLHGIAEDVDGRWYLLETANLVDEAESRKENDVAAKLESFMQQYLKENTDELGVHYSDLFEQYLPIQDKPRRLMQEWLPEFFFKTEEGTWRPPANDEEREQKEALRTSGTLRRIKRFANALLEGVPPYEKDIPTNTATAADWIRQCRRAGLYEQGRALYEKGGFTFDGLSEEAQMEVEEDYQICVRRSN